MKTLINSKLPEFELQAFHPEKDDFFAVKNDDIKDKWAVFFFYPADFTFVCPTELEDLAAHHEQLKKLGVEVYSVSTDTHFSHKAWHDSSPRIKKINYTMLADPTHKFSKALGVYEKNEGIAYRGTFVVSPEGDIKIMEIHDNGIGRNASELVRKIEAAIHVRDNDGEACPANWKKGDKALNPSLDLVGEL